MEIEQPTVEAQLLSHAERQTKALETLRTIAVYYAWAFGVVAFFAVFFVLIRLLGAVS